MKRTAAAVVVLIAIALAVFLWKRKGDGDQPAGGDAGPVAAQQQAPQQQRLSAQEQSSLLQNMSLQVDAEKDPIGNLRLEGQVVDDLDQGVGDAEIWLSASPTRTATSEDDGTFVFDELIAKTYYLRARRGELVGGPIQIDLTAKTDPIVIRVRTGAVLEVHVAGENDAPVAGATVRLRPDDASETTNGDGVATFRGVGRGARVINASAPGYAPANQLVQIAPTADRATERIVLVRGAPVSGRVVDSGGKPVAGATVVAQDASALFPRADAVHAGAKTGADGTFRIAAVPAGAHRLVARHEEYPPGSSEPIQLDGVTEKSGVTIELKDGVTVAGKVVTSTGEPGKWATVRVGPSSFSGFTGFTGVRQVIAEEDGSFELKGLARTQVIAVASNNQASSETVEVDLVARGDVRDLVLTLDVDGAIAGTVVDHDGEPVAEAQVFLWPDFLGGGTISDWGVRGSGACATDGGGRFRFSGVPAGKYRVRAARDEVDEEAWLNPGVPAEPGDMDVRIVLAPKGSVKGRVLFARGDAPELFSVSVGARTPHPVSGSKGAFRIDGVTAGKYDVVIRGAGFTEKVLRDVEVEGGDATDLGTITVERGRAAFGKVVDAAGAPVEGAEVVHASGQLLSDGKKLGGSLALLDEQLGLKRAKTDAQGVYRIDGIGKRRSTIAAEHPERGRSLPVDIGPGEDDVQIALPLLPFGALQGKVTAGGKAPPQASVLASPTAAASPILVQAGDGGSYVMEKLAAGDYQVTAMIQSEGGLGATSASRTVTVAPGKTTTLDINVVIGDITLKVKVTGKDGAKVDAAQVFLFDGKVDYKTAQELNKAYMGGGGEGNQRMGFQMGDRPAVIPQLEAGNYTVCVIPITGDMNDPTFMQRIQRHVDILKVYCSPVTLPATPKEQLFETAVPAMAALPADE